MYMQTTAFYNYRWHMTIPVFTTFVRGLTALHYARHFDNFFKFCPDILRMVDRDVYFTLRGWCMDFSDAQFIGLSLAYGKFYLRRVHHDIRIEADLKFIGEALNIGDQFVKKYCKGCDFHWGQAVHRMAIKLSADTKLQDDFKFLAFNWQKAKSIQDGQQVVRKIRARYPELAQWVDWWQKRAHLVILAEMTAAKSDDIMRRYPTTDNMLESFHATFQKVVPRDRLPLFLAVVMLYQFVENLRVHSVAIASGHAKPKRKRGKIHDGDLLAKRLVADEWTEPRPEDVRKAKLRTRNLRPP
jgi:hypothetical protein